MNKRDYYEILGVSKSATDTEIKAAYRKKALEWHPDRNKAAGAAEKFKEIGEAYQILSDPQKKSTYDQFGHSAFEQGGGAGSGAYRQGPFTYTYSTGGQGFEGFDMGGFSDPFEIFNSFFGGGFGGGGRSSYGDRRRRSQYSLGITFDEAIGGVEKTIVIEGERRTIKIPAGVDTGSRIRFADFDVVLEVSASRIYQRDGDDLYLDQELDLMTAITGGEIEVPTPKGKLKIKIHSGTQHGTMIRLANRGVPHINRSTSGDLYVRLKVKIPTKVPECQKSSGFSWF